MENTIHSVAHDDCTGCGVCVNKCPRNAVAMQYSDEGFLYPEIKPELCIHCGQCLAVCPAEHPLPLHETPESYAVWASDEVRLKSSSGGMFTLLADWVLAQKGAVCGAAYAPDYQTVYHCWAESQEELGKLRGSKYVQSDTQLTYRQAKEYLDAGRVVLYTGCPCQIAGLYRYLGKEYANFYTADLVCHGSNSVKAYQSFLKEFSEGQEIEKVDFRDKKYYTWSTPTVVYLKNGEVKKAAWDEGTWYTGFLNGIINRMNCYHCPYARAERVADITLADCWQVYRFNSAYDDRKGTSLVLVNDEKGRRLIDAVRPQMKLCEPVPLEEMRKYNGQLNGPTQEHRSRKYFFSHLDELGYHKALWYGRGMRFDLGILGWWFASNYGSSLTYYALGRVLEQMGKQILLIRVPKLDNTAWEPQTQQTIDFLSRYFYISADRDFDRMTEYNHFCDGFMLGSDQMWTKGATELVGYSFFLDFAAKDKKKIAFSTSFGHANFSDDLEMQETARDFLRRFDSVSVREDSGVALCRDVFGLKAEQVIDPVFLCPREQYDLLADQNNDPVPERYLLCYILDPSARKEAAAQALAKQLGMEVLTILGLKEYDDVVNNWHTGTVLPCMTTEKFLYYIKRCSYLLTDSHHGTCFGILYEKPYTALVNAERGATRFETVAERLDLREHLVYDPAEIGADYPIPSVDYDHVRPLLEKEKARALHWLEEALQKPVGKPPEDTLHTVAQDSRRRYYGVANRMERYHEEERAEINTLHQQVEWDRNELERRQKELEMQQRELEMLRQRMDAMEHSVFRRMERKILWLPKKIRGGIWCLRDNGLKYTVVHFCEKVQRKLH